MAETSKKQYFGIRFLAPEFEGRIGFSPCIDMKLMLKSRFSENLPCVGILYTNNAGKTINVIAEITGFKWIQNQTMGSIETVICCDSWKIIKEVEL